MSRVLIPIQERFVAPRFDMTPEVWLGHFEQQGKVPPGRILVLSHPSEDQVCQMALDERVSVIICGGIDEQYYEYLTWKKIQVFDSVIGNYMDAAQAFAEGRLQPEMIFHFGFQGIESS